MSARPIPTARSVAADVLVRVFRDDAFAAAVLDAELERNVQLEGRDRALATELVYGTLRTQRWLEQRIARHAPRGIDSLGPLVRATLVVAAYQILALSRIPAFAAVNEAVSAARFARGAKVAGFVNAVLRKVAAEPKPSAHDLACAAFDSLDGAVADALERAVGRDGAIALLGSGEVPSSGLRIEDPARREEWVSRWSTESADQRGASFVVGRHSPLAVVVRGAGRVVDLPGFAEGAFTPQEEGSQIVALALGARPGETVLDACAGRGGKTGILARAVGKGAVDAADVHAAKLERLAHDLRRLGLGVRSTYPVDWACGCGDVKGGYDRILVDAPCSGTGTLRRRPELLVRRPTGHWADLAVLQREILERVSSLVRPGGRVVYAVCSVLREEAEEVVAHAAAFGLRPSPFDSDLPVLASQETVRLLPHVHGTDGYFLASFVRD